MIVAIDGPAASGKSTTARGVARRLGFVYLDTGAMYRAVTLAVLRAGIEPKSERAVGDLLRGLKLSFESRDAAVRILLGDEDISEPIRGLDVTNSVSAVSALPVVRRKMVPLQRSIASRNDSVVEGRDIGTVVFPDADLKFYLTADYETRAERRRKDLEELGIERSIGEIIEDLEHRDHKDRTRSHSPLIRAEDAVEVDTTALSIEEQIEFIVTRVHQQSEEKEV